MFYAGNVFGNDVGYNAATLPYLAYIMTYFSALVKVNAFVFANFPAFQ